MPSELEIMINRIQQLQKLGVFTSHGAEDFIRAYWMQAQAEALEEERVA
jgi:hypothetical protein